MKFLVKLLGTGFGNVGGQRENVGSSESRSDHAARAVQGNRSARGFHRLVLPRIIADAALDAIYVPALCVDGYFSEVLLSGQRPPPPYSPPTRRVHIKLSDRVEPVDRMLHADIYTFIQSTFLRSQPCQAAAAAAASGESCRFIRVR